MRSHEVAQVATAMTIVVVMAAKKAQIGSQTSYKHTTKGPTKNERIR